MKVCFFKRTAALIFACVLLLGLTMPAAALTFPDVPQGKWYAEYVAVLTDLGMLCGYTDQTFRPERTLTRGEFIKLVDKCVGGSVPEKQGVDWARGYLADLIDKGVVLPYEIPDTVESLNTDITRYEMAMILVRAADLLGDIEADVSDARNALTDYSLIPAQYIFSVLQAYARGLLNGYTDGTFGGDRCLSRAEAAAVITRLLFPDMRITPSQGLGDGDSSLLAVWQTTEWMSDIAEIEAASAEPPLEEPDDPGGGSDDGGQLPGDMDDDFAAVTGAVGFMSTEEQRMLLFGDSAKTCFDSEAEAVAHMAEVTVPIWTKCADGTKRESAVTLTVNAALADDVKGIFNLIFNGPEQYCVIAIGGYAWTSSSRSEHNWGAAIDLNPFANPYINAAGTILVGEYYDPADEYSLSADSDVVRAFAAYGWGWGGEGRWSSGALDYMHLSLMGT